MKWVTRKLAWTEDTFSDWQKKFLSGLSEKDLWNLYGTVYDSIRVIPSYCELLYDHACKIVETLSSEKEQMILDFGSGTGTLGLFISRFPHWLSNKSVRYHCVELNQVMIFQAKIKLFFCKRKNLKFSFSKKLSGYANGSFDHIASLNVLYLMDNPGETLCDLHRVLKPGGRIWLTTVVKDPDMGPVLKRINLEEVNFFVRWIFSNWAVPINREIKKRGEDKEYVFFVGPELKKLLEGVGFVNVEFGETYDGTNIWIAGTKR